MSGQLSAHRHYDLMPQKPTMPECPSTTFSNPSNASKLFSPAFTEERGPIEGKEDRFLRKEQVPRILQNGILVFKRIPVISGEGLL